MNQKCLFISSFKGINTVFSLVTITVLLLPPFELLFDPAKKEMYLVLKEYQKALL